MLQSKNLNYVYNKEYPEALFSCSEAKDVNNEFLSLGITKSQRYDISNCSFDLQTRYPGLLIGTGNVHNTGLSTGEYQLGFTFDYVTGEPYIPGSSLKGVLRSAFEHKDYITYLLGTDDIDVKKLEEEIFDGIADNKDMPIEKRDKFLDCFVNFDKINNASEDGKYYLIDKENITPHKSPIKNPIPIAFVKVKPGVVFSFSFILFDGIITAGEKLELFKKILMDLGIGAKTNVGFGVLDEVDSNIKLTGKPIVKPSSIKNNSSNPRPESNNGNKPKRKEAHGVCKSCGKPTKKIPNTDKYFSYCWECNQRRKNNGR